MFLCARDMGCGADSITGKGDIFDDCTWSEQTQQHENLSSTLFLAVFPVQNTHADPTKFDVRSAMDDCAREIAIKQMLRNTI